MYKLIASDVDETLIDDEKIISNQNLNAIKSAINLGCTFIIATGRAYLNIIPLIQQLKEQNVLVKYAITCNGGWIVNTETNTDMALYTLSYQDTCELFKIAEQHNFGVHIYTTKHTYVYNLSKDEQTYIDGRLHDTITLDPTLKTQQIQNEKIIKILFNDKLSKLQQTASELPATILEKYSITFSANRYFEFNPPNINKGNGVKLIAEHLNILPQHILAIGDNNNDISMLEFAGLGACVQNATTETKQSADFISEYSNNQSAVADIINKFILTAQ